MMKRALTVLVLLFTIGAAKAQDWPNLKRYQDVNSKVPPPSSGEKRVVYIGDSITDFWINNDSTFFASNSYLNRGISGQTTGQMLLRFRQDVIDLKPSVVVILAGINDIAQNNGPERLEDIFGNIISMVELARANHIKVVISSILPAFTIPWRQAIDPVPQIAALNEMLKTYADKNKITYLDYFTAMADARKGLPANLSKDGLHPNLNGYKVMEPLAEKAIHEALNNK
ncbi:Lysophospholipase L1 [Mucilaginibacter mallensis]|uniref:Lysophospholipase L1 n=1 Tax=Mucilaginibacter mallensis TaxID=652787 RepID=A0A1H1VI20_MUCMA|nr:SGNH/GDSL hydrolase family protein [Mucilaginibacter mallensis]SDS84574.1 Lysophospholipase L1 [Mucilaginibacter mallensis]